MAKKVYPREFIGQEIEILASKNKSNLGLEGKVVDETKYTIRILHQGKIKSLMKNNITFRLKKSSQVIAGKEIALRPEERIKGR